MRISEAHLASLATLLRERVGFEVRPETHSLLRLALSERLRGSEEGQDVGRYLEALRERSDELERLLPLVTVGKTSFFRDAGQFRALEAVLPDLLAEARRERRRLSIWSAGCASGEEPYSIAITLLEAGASPDEVEFLATDLNPEAVAFAAAGRYRKERVEGIARGKLERFFVEEDRGYAVRPRVREMIGRLETHNLHSERTPLPASGGWDVIFCRNVLIYFDKVGIRSVVGRFHETMRPGAWLFLGYSESLFKLFDGFQLVEQNGSFLYRKPLAPCSSAEPRPPIVVRADEPPRRAQPRPPPLPREPAPRDPPPGPDDLRQAVRLIERGSFLEACALLEGSVSRGGGLAFLLTLANVHVLLRRPSEAEACFQRALAAEPASGETFLYQGMFLLDRGQYERAELSLSRAVYLEPDFALAHYLLGKCQEKLRNLESARRSYRNALRSLRLGQRELAAFYPDLPRDPDAVAHAAALALAAL